MIELDRSTIQIHFILRNKLYAVKYACHTPYVDDEIRLSDGKFYRVKRLVWVYDEPECYYDRVNIEIKKIRT